MMKSKVSMQLRKLIAKIFPGRFPALYSTLDDPIEVPVQVAAYQLAVDKYIQKTDRVLDVGFGLGYGLRIMAPKCTFLAGIDVDKKVMQNGQRLVGELQSLAEVLHYGGMLIPYPDASFDLITCIDVIEHVKDYIGLLREMLRVSRRYVFISTPNRRPEYTRPNGRPANPWHLREWSYRELARILGEIPGTEVQWNFLDGPWEGQFQVGAQVSKDTMALSPAIRKLAKDER